ncbi:hypothetical protein FRC06_003790, partial [Ceratobasidium sp. 370]
MNPRQLARHAHGPNPLPSTRPGTLVKNCDTQLGYALHPTDEAPPYAPANPKVSAAVGKSVTTAEKSMPAAAHPDPLKPAAHPKPVRHAAPAQATQRIAPWTVENPDTPAVRATSAAPAMRAVSAAPAVRATSAAPARRATPAAPTMRATSATPAVCAAPAAPAVRVASVAPAVHAIAAGPAGPAPPGKSTSRSVSASGVAPSGHVVSANHSRSATPVMQLYLPAMSQAESETLHRELLTMQEHLPLFVVNWVPNWPGGSPGRGEYNLEETFGFSTDVYWTIQNVCQHALLQTPRIDVTKPVTLRRPKGIVRKVVNMLAPVFPEFDNYRLVDNYVLEDFCHAILQSSANTFGQQKKNPPCKSRKQGRRKTKSKEVEEMPNEVADEVANEVVNAVANEDMAKPLNDLDKVMEYIANDAGDDVGMWDNAECKPIAALAPPATLANDPTDNLIGNFSMTSIQPDDESTDILPQAVLTPVLMQMSPPRAKPNPVPVSTLPATHMPRRAATQVTPSISTTTSTATSTASTMSTSTASSMTMSTGTPARRLPGTPKSPGFYVNSKMLGQMEEIMELPEDEHAGHFSSVLKILLLGMAAGKLPATNPTSSAGQGDPDSEANAPLEFESEPKTENPQGADDSDSLSDPPEIEGGGVIMAEVEDGVDNVDDNMDNVDEGEDEVVRAAVGVEVKVGPRAKGRVGPWMKEEMGEGPCHSTRNRNPSNDMTDKGKAKVPAAAKPMQHK